MKPSISDVLIFFGLSLIGGGLFLLFGPGVALAVDGTLILTLGVMGNKPEPRK
jgi:hypothetical protein